ncbi:hypothetical protein [Anaerosporobacter sp.]
MGFVMKESTREEKELLRQKYNTINAYSRTRSGWGYYVVDEEREVYLTWIAAGRGKSELQPDIYAFIYKNIVCKIELYVRYLEGTIFLEIVTIFYPLSLKPYEKEMYKLIKEALTAFMNEKDRKIVIENLKEI